MWPKVHRGAAVVLLALVPCGRMDAGVLRDFENDVTKKDASEESSRPHDRDGDHRGETHDRSDWDGLWGGLTDNIVTVVPWIVVGGGIYSWERVTAVDTNDVNPRRPNEPLIPFFRAEVSALAVSGDIEARTGRVEAGYGPVAVEVDLLSFEEGATGDELEIRRICGLYRMSFGRQIEVDLGIGSLTLEGENKTSELAYTVPVLVYPADWWGIEFRPAWAEFEGSTLEDYDLGLFLNWKGISFKAGYRWLQSDHEDLSGPYLGLAYRY